MNKLHKRRLYYLSFFTLITTIAVGLILFALKQNINVFLTPSQITANITPDYPFRLGGMVKKGSLVRDKQGLGLQFIVTDLKKETLVRYEGVLPDLFREGKGMIAQGHIDQHHIFIASQILAKHDENYMPKNVYKELREKS